ncbi:MAG: 2-isopropylmalate synthase [Desulfobacteraceae bacterium]|nr:2-isopropylmalate synthase [Desulfobacteraceae bacterium]
MNNRLFIFDTTLRDGEQAAGTRLGSADKLEIARQLSRLGVDIIEAGFPSSSPEDFEAVSLIAREITEPVICGLSRAVAEDIQICGRAIAKARRPRIHTGLGVSDIHVIGKFNDDKYGKTLEEKRATLLKMAVNAVKVARDFTNDVQFFAEDAGRAHRPFLFEVLEAVIDAGATVLNIPDTTGYAIPEQYGALIRDICSKVKNSGKVVISVHCHDDLGMAVANSLAGVKNGARQVEGTINGIGERAGNAAMEEIVMAIQTRQDYFCLKTQMKPTEFYRTSRMVAAKLGMTIPPNKAVIGGNAFSHSSGIHVDGVLKERQTYEIINPEDVGFPASRIVLTARTGHAGVKHRLEELGYTFAKEELDQVYQRFLKVADKKQEVFDDDLAAIVRDEIHPVPEIYRLDYWNTSTGKGTIPSATVRLSIGKDEVEIAAWGDGPVDALFKAISMAANKPVELKKYEIKAVTSGAKAMGEVNVQLEESGVAVTGYGASTDIIEASAKAYIDGLNRLYAVREERDHAL